MWVDTSVWIKYAYTRTHVNEARPYANYIKALMNAGSNLFAGIINYAEVSKHVEATELNVWMQKNGDTRPHHMMLKTFRADVAERMSVVAEIETAWAQMASVSQLSKATLQPTCLLEVVKGMETGNFLDGPDALQLREATLNGIDQILTADKDFASVPNVTVFTALRSVIEAARQAGTIVVR